ncbi:MAG: ABC-2 family transporter protein [Opitutaceae bacterium]|nr:ABC-2 family transporter protein [Opitutaceae bacterium]
MRTTLHKYRHVYLVGLQSNLVYRGNFAARGLFSLFHLVVVFILWGAVYVGNDRVGGFDLRQTLTYFVIMLPLQFIIGAFNEDYQISEEIRNGLINQFLLKPVNYFAYRFSVFLSARSVSGVLVFLPLALALPFIHHQLSFPPEGWRLALGLPAMFMSALIQFTIAFCFGLLSFWFLEIQSFVILSFAIETLLGGQVFPLDLMPAALYRLSQFLPYYYQMYFPAAIFSGRLDLAQTLEGLSVQAAWVVLLFLLARLLWARGLRHHTAVGG